MTEAPVPISLSPAKPLTGPLEKRGRHFRPGTHPLALPLGTILPVTIGDLPSHTFQVKPEVEAIQIVREMERDPELPGVLIVKGYECIGMVSRQKLFEQLGRPFGVDVFLNRPIITLQEAIEHDLTVLPAHTRIDEAVQIALTRPREHRYEPIVVQRPDQQFQLLDLPVLLLAQSNLLAHANRLIKHQIEIGQALVSTADPAPVLELIVERLKGIVPYNRAGLLIETGNWLDYAIYDGFPTHTSRQKLRVRSHENDVYLHLCQTRRSLCVPAVVSGQHWKYLDNFPTVRTWLAVPLQREGSVIGMLFLMRVFVNMPYTQDDVEMIETFAAQASVALQGARLASDERALLARQKDLSRFALPAWSLVQTELNDVLAALANISQAILDIPPDALTDPLRQQFMSLQAVGRRLRLLLQQVSAPAGAPAGAPEKPVSLPPSL